MINLMAVNAQSLNDLMTYLNIVWSGPLQILLSLFMLWQYLGVASLIGTLIR